MSVKVMRIREMNMILADTPLDKIAGLLTEHRIGGLPGVYDKNRAIGMVTGSHLFLEEKGMPFSLFRFPRLSRCWEDLIQFIVQSINKRVPGLHEHVSARGKA